MYIECTCAVWVVDFGAFYIQARLSALCRYRCRGRRLAKSVEGMDAPEAWHGCMTVRFRVMFTVHASETIIYPECQRPKYITKFGTRLFGVPNQEKVFASMSLTAAAAGAAARPARRHERRPCPRGGGGVGVVQAGAQREQMQATVA